MSRANGMAAFLMQNPDVIPRTEYSAHRHWPLVSKVTGIEVGPESDTETQARASAAFLKAWDYGMMWSTLTYNQIFEGKYTKMGHAVYADGGVDYSADVNRLFQDPEDVFSFDPFAEFSPRDLKTLTREYNEALAAGDRAFPDTVNMTGIYVTCMSGLIELMGWDTLLNAAGIDPDAFGAFINRYAQWIQQYFNALAKSDAPVVMVHDDIVWTSGAFLRPAFYRKFIFPNYRKYFEPLHEAGKIILFTSDGDYTEFVDDVAACGVNGFVMEPCTDLAYVAGKYGKTHALIGNCDTRVLLFGSKDDIRKEVKRCMDIGRDCPGFMLAVGNHIPANTPVDNALYYNDCYLETRKRG